MKMKKAIASTMVLLALCLPALAEDMPNMVGNWTGFYEGPAYRNITSQEPAGDFAFFEMGNYTWTFIIEEQNGAGFVGKKTSSTSPQPQRVVGIVGFDNKTVSMVDEEAYFWGQMISPTRLELIHMETGIGKMGAIRSVLTKE
jgi:hypothetical protein